MNIDNVVALGNDTFTNYDISQIDEIDDNRLLNIIQFVIGLLISNACINLCKLRFN